jgi:hypothetical protein
VSAQSINLLHAVAYCGQNVAGDLPSQSGGVNAINRVRFRGELGGMTHAAGGRPGVFAPTMRWRQRFRSPSTTPRNGGIIARYREILERTRALTGVEAAGVIRDLPFEAIQRDVRQSGADGGAADTPGARPSVH